MRTFSTFLLAVCAAAALTAHAPAQQATPADKASVDAFLTACAPQIAAMRKEMAAHGETFTEDQLRGYFEPLPAAMREMAQDENMPLPDVLREGMSRTRAAMNDPNSTDPSDKLIGPPMICFLELLIARDAGQPAPAPAPPVSTAQAVANSGGCLTIDWRGGTQGDPAILGNVCSYAINVGVCVRQAAPGSASENVACEQARFTSYRIGPGGAVTVPATHGTVQTRVCTPPQTPALWWENGTSVGNCR